MRNLFGAVCCCLAMGMMCSNAQASNTDGSLGNVSLAGLVTDGSGSIEITVTRDNVQLFVSGVALTGTAAQVPEPSLWRC